MNGETWTRDPEAIAETLKGKRITDVRFQGNSVIIETDTELGFTLTIEGNAVWPGSIVSTMDWGKKEAGK